MSTVAKKSKRKTPRTGGSRIAAVRTALTAWLGRPLASFHLILAVFSLLTAIGLVMVLSASSVQTYTDNQSSYAVFGKQLIFTAVGLLLFWIGLRTPLRRIRQLSPIGVVVSIMLLALVLTPLGRGANGREHAWFVVGSLSFQPVEAAKLGLALWGAHVLVTKRALLNQYRHLFVPVVPVALVMFALVMLQPDLGSTLALAVILFALLWFVGAPLRLFAVILAAAVVAIIPLSIGASYRSDRWKAFLNPDADPLGLGAQSKQALYALADGGLFGRGLGQGAAKWGYLPNVQSDFIFALIGEELGFVGAILVLGLFAALAIVGLRTAARNTDPWIRLTAATITAWLVGQATINIGQVVGLFPVTGIPLPLISAGGTSAVITMLSLGILANCARNEPASVAALRSLGPGRVGGLLRLPAPEPYRSPGKRRPVRPSTPPRSGARADEAAGRGAAMPLAGERRRAHRSAPPTEYRRRSAWRDGPAGPRFEKGDS